MTDLTIGILEEQSPDSDLGRQWEAIVQSNPYSGIMQSLNWAAMKRRQGLGCVHMGVFENGNLAGGALFYTAKKLNGAGILVAPEGPVLNWDDRARATNQLRILTDAAKEYAYQNGIMAMRIEPRLPIPVPPLLREFGRAPVDLVPRDTLYLNLTEGEDAILAQMKPKGRYNIRLAEKHGVEVTEYNAPSTDEINEFYEAVFEASSRDEFALEPKNFFHHLAGVLCPSNNASFLFARHQGDLLGALLLVRYGKRATYLYGGTTNKKRELMGGYALQWAAIQKARREACTVYDFYGYVPHRSPQHQYARFSQFKSQFGGNAVRLIGAQDYFFLDNVARALIKAAQEVDDILVSTV